MRPGAVLLLVGVLLAAAIPVSLEAPPATPGPVSHVSPDNAAPGPTPQYVQQVSVAYRSVYEKANFWQNTTHTFGNGNTPATITNNLTGAAYTTVYSDDLFVTASLGKYNLTPIVNVTQSTKPLANVTSNAAFPVGATAGGNTVSARVVGAWTPTGGIPAEQLYPAFFNFTQTVTYLYAPIPVWTLVNGTSENTSYKISVPTGYRLNQTTVFLPYPTGATANATTLKVTLNGANLTTYALEAGGIEATVAAAASTSTLAVSYNVTGTYQGKVPILTMSAIQLQSNRWYYATAAWVNKGALPWFGEYLVLTNHSTLNAIDPTSLNVTANLHWLRNNSWGIQSSQIVIAPGIWQTNGGQVTVFTFHFHLLGTVPSFAACVTCPVSAGSPVTWSEVTAGLAGSLLLYVVWGWSTSRRDLSMQGYEFHASLARDGWLAAVFLFVVVVVVYVGLLVLQLTGV